MRSKHLGFMLAAFVAATGPQVCGATVLFDISMTTSPLIGDPAAPFSLEFQFNDGSGSNDGNNTVILDQFAFGPGGGPLGLPSAVGGVTGDLGTSVTLVDNSFFNQFIQQFTPGATLQFRVSSTTNLDAGGVPDEFTFSILDQSGTEIPTVGFFDVFVQLDIDSANPVPTSFGSDTLRNTAAGGAPIDVAAPVVAASAPEPATAGSLLASLLLFAASYKSNSRRARVRGEATPSPASNRA
jgi:hypothetical protein